MPNLLEAKTRPAKQPKTARLAQVLEDHLSGALLTGEEHAFLWELNGRIFC